MTMPADRLTQIDNAIAAAQERVAVRTAAGSCEPEIRTLIHAAEVMRKAIEPAAESDADPDPSNEMAQFYGELCDVVERAWMRVPVTRGPDEMRYTSDYAREGANRILELVGQAMAAGVVTGVDYDDLAVEERDEAIEAADQVTEVIEAITGVDAGEHTDTNEPWKNAIVAGEAYAQASDFEYGVRWVKSGTIHREGQTEAEARAFLDPADWDAPLPVHEVFEVVRRRRGPWHVAP